MLLRLLINLLPLGLNTLVISIGSARVLLLQTESANNQDWFFKEATVAILMAKLCFVLNRLLLV
jgi:hypothetical protein